GAAVTGVGAAAFPARLDECTGATLAAGRRGQVLLRLDTLARCGRRVPAAHRRVGRRPRRPLYGLVIGGYTRDGDAEPGSRCKSGAVFATVTRELESHVATGPAGL